MTDFLNYDWPVTNCAEVSVQCDRYALTYVYNRETIATVETVNISLQKSLSSSLSLPPALPLPHPDATAHLLSVIID